MEIFPYFFRSFFQNMTFFAKKYRKKRKRDCIEEYSVIEYLLHIQFVSQKVRFFKHFNYIIRRFCMHEAFCKMSLCSYCTDAALPQM